jgi:hypothetical protein
MSEVRPWDLLNPENHETNQDEIQRRLEICYTCPAFRKSTQQCKKCGCFMKLKTRLKEAHCPIGKW